MTFHDMLYWVQNRTVLPVFIVFTMIVVATYWPGRKKQIEEHGMILFREQPPVDEAPQLARARAPRRQNRR